MNRLLLSLLLLVSANAQADVFRCKVNGKTSYQDKPCAGQSREDSRAKLPPISVIGNMGQGGKGAESSGPFVKPPPLPAGDVSTAIKANRVLLGMTGQEILAAAGQYSDHKTTPGSDAQGPYEIWTFAQRQGAFPPWVKVREGVAVETRTTLDGSAEVPPPPPAPPGTPPAQPAAPTTPPPPPAKPEVPPPS
ncbi:DUF4124 domain-containing protein [Solimonas sp. K1W22B-7]|uniref:DUF4124 domain-containing protein n=1 Tax=Solimonas sp. K1W22B-7 TaxID=2303331 RepID=UPI0013C46500|nr:DUF4124 domain-containing protein [Solimonas sp. K1W22B-7]